MVVDTFGGSGSTLMSCEQMNRMQGFDKDGRRNQVNSDYVVAVWNGKPSGTGNTIKYAAQQGKPVYCISSVDFRMSAI